MGKTKKYSKSNEFNLDEMCFHSGFGSMDIRNFHSSKELKLEVRNGRLFVDKEYFNSWLVKRGIIIKHTKN